MDILSNSSVLVRALAGFIILGLALAFVKPLFRVLWVALGLDDGERFVVEDGEVIGKYTFDHEDEDGETWYDNGYGELRPGWFVDKVQEDNTW